MKKYILFGAGYLGKIAFDCFGEDLIEYFVDSSKCGQEYCGKHILSINELEKIACNYIIVISVKDRVEEVESQLQQMGIMKYYIYSEYDYYVGKHFNVVDDIKHQLRIIDYIKYYDTGRYHSIAIEGEPFKSKILIDMLNAESGDLSVKYIINSYSQVEEDLEYYGYPVRDFSEIQNDIDLLVLLESRERSTLRDILAEEKRDFMIADFSNTEDLFGENRNPELSKYKDIHKGERCFIIGNGPSIRTEDLEKLCEKNETTFACNQIYKVYDKVKWRPDYFVMQDNKCIIEFYNEVLATVECTKFIGDYIKDIWDGRETHNLEKIHMRAQSYLPHMPGFSSDIVNGVYEGWNVIYSSIQIAAYMGFEEIYIIGVDMKFTANLKENSNHFIDDYFGKMKKINPPNYEAVFSAFKKAELYSRQHNFRIYNATRGGAVEEFERVNFDSLF
ncbi:6-hydroxymethylpterin diphosphokinase MptE-like protein [Candidatus Clostridium helianthi]|uniref:6-hydroxymethylpterin diphosphokinase MptE-like protein n=1 Tax=Candidatus Clostridium helianthi TaxID=3381660 RepID=A0ABW8S3R9_9CLOT